MEQNLLLKPVQTQTLTQYQLMSLNLLAMDTMELNRYLQEEYCSNPLLEEKERSTDTAVPMTPVNRTGKRQRQRIETLIQEDIPTEAFSPLEEFILEQLSEALFPAEEYVAARRMVHCLDDDGYYRLSKMETVALTGLSSEKNSEILRKLKTLNPPGIFAADFMECISLQLAFAGEDPTLYQGILECGLDAIAGGQINQIAQKTGLSKQSVRTRLNRIRSLSPKPLSGLTQTHSDYIVPDVIFLLDNGEIIPILNDQWTANYGLSDYYCQLMNQENDPELKAYFRSKFERAAALIKGIEQRRQTILSICSCIIRRQREYILGHGTPMPMMMTEIADELGIHPSTVSRALKGKYIQLPRGAVSAKSFFTSSFNGADVEAHVSSNHVRQWIQDTIAKEDPSTPYSDQALADMLRKEGIKVSRRVIAKYRDELFIPSSYLRKK